MPSPIYRARASILFSNEDGTQQILGGETVFESENETVSTGLLDATGQPIYRVRVHRSIGFDLARHP